MLKLNVQCWEAYQTYSQTLREMCNPCRDIELDERLKGVYGPMHPQAFKIAAHLVVLDRLDTEESTPLLLNSTGSVAKRLPRCGVAVQRGCCIKWIAVAKPNTSIFYSSAFWQCFDGWVSGRKALCGLQKLARQVTEELVRAGILIPLRLGQAEGYLHKDFVQEVSQ